MIPTLLLACTSPDPVVTVAEYLPPELGPVNLVVFDQILADLSVANAAVSSTQEPILLGLSYEPAVGLALPLADAADGCWPVPDMPAPGGVDLTGLVVGFDGLEVTLDPLDDGVYMTFTGGTQAEAASTAGNKLSIDGQATGVHVPPALVLHDGAGSWQGLVEDGVLVLDWDWERNPPGPAYLGVDLDTDEGWFQCVLDDDGRAEIDLGFVPGGAVSLLVGRHETAVVETVYGTTLVSAQQDLQFQGD